MASKYLCVADSGGFDWEEDFFGVAVLNVVSVLVAEVLFVVSAGLG